MASDKLLFGKYANDFKVVLVDQDLKAYNATLGAMEVWAEGNFSPNYLIASSLLGTLSPIRYLQIPAALPPGNYAGFLYLATNPDVLQIPDDEFSFAWTGSNLVLADSIGVVQETRDLEPPQFTWRLTKDRAGGSIRSADVLKIGPGETITAGFDCYTGLVLPRGSVVESVGTPTGLTGELSAVKQGTNGRYVNLSITATAGATDGTVQYLQVPVTNSFGDGPMILVGKVEVETLTV